MTFEWGTIVKSINWTLVLNLINFAILLYILNRLLFKPAAKYLDQRRELIASRMENARNDEQRAAALVADREGELQQARDRGEQMIEDSRQRATGMIDEAKVQAKSEAERIVTDARHQMEQERDRMIEDLKVAYADLAVLGAERVLDREVRTEDHRRLLDQLLAEIDEDALKVGP